METIIKNRKLYNHYGEIFEDKLPEHATTWKNKVNQVKHEYERQLTKLKLQKKKNKELFLRAKSKLLIDRERRLNSLRMEYQSNVRVTKESIKHLQKLLVLKDQDNLANLIKFEIKKTLKKIKDNKNYHVNSFKWAEKTTDLFEEKLEKLELITHKCQQEELVLQNFYNSLVILLGKANNKELTEEELDFESKNSNIINDLERTLRSNLVKNWDNYSSRMNVFKNEVKVFKEKYQNSKKSLRTEIKVAIKNAEYSYNFEFQKNKDYIFEHKQKHISDLKNTKADAVEIDTLINGKIKSFKDSKKIDIALMNSFKNQYVQLSVLTSFAHHLIEKLNVIKFDVNKINSLAQIVENTATFMNSSFSPEKINLLSKEKLDSHKQEITNLIKELKEIIKIQKANSIIFKIKLSDHFGCLGELEFKQLWKKKAKAEFAKIVAPTKSCFTYDGDYDKENSKHGSEFVTNWTQELSELITDYKKSKLHLLELKSNNTKEKEVQWIAEKINNLKDEYKLRIDNAKLLLQNSEITPTALKQIKYEQKIILKESIKEIKLSSEYGKAKNILSSFKWRYLGRRKIWKKIYGSKTVETRRILPIESVKGVRWFAFFANLVIPGSAEIIFFKQWAKGSILLIITLLLYLIGFPFAFGLIGAKFNGVFGMFDMGKKSYNWELGIMPDARYYLLGGIVSIFLLVAISIFAISSSISAYNTGKVMEYGARPMGWESSRRWLQNQGFPWLISLPAWTIILFIVVTPILTSLLISFTNMGFNHTPPSQTVDWVGLEQFGKWWLFREAGMAKSMGRVLSWSLIWTLSSSTLVIVLGTLVAVVVNQDRIKMKKLWRMIYIIPWAIPAFVTIMFLKSAFQPDAGSLFNMLFMKLGIISKPFAWTQTIWRTRLILIIIQGWLGHSYIFLLVTGNMQSIPTDIYEAGSLDGAKGNQMFRHMTLPILLSSIAPLLISQFTFNFNNFTIISMFSGGAPAFTDPTPFLEGGTDILISWIYKLTTNVAQIDGNMAFSSAMTILAAMISVGVASYGFAKSAAFRGH